jgi:transcriptional regulator with AAA-type ATPase domain
LKVTKPDTQPESQYGADPTDVPMPGVVMVVVNNAATLRTFPLSPTGLMLGRKIGIPDPIMSDEHAELSYAGGAWSVKDGSSNGSSLNGQKFTGETQKAKSPAVLRLGYSIFLLFDDVRRFMAATVKADDGYVVGPTLDGPHRQIVRAAMGGAKTLLILGETGTGKEHAAALFHQHAAKGGPYETFNSATFDKGTADSTLFGHVKGAFTGATADKQGVAHAADGGVLFLDELGDLDVELQAKLLRFVELGEVRRVGATSAEKVSVRIVSATNRNLEEAMANGKFREDLYERLAEVTVRLPPLRDRLEDIPHIVEAMLALGQVRQAHATFIEALLLRDWPRNVRQLRNAVKEAAARAADRIAAARPDSKDAKDRKVRDKDLPASTTAAKITPARAEGPPTKGEIEQALAKAGGNVSQAARDLGEHRTQLLRWMKKFGINGAAGEMP